MKFDNGKILATMCGGKIEIKLLTKSDLESALDVLDKSFFLNEPVCIGCEIILPENILARHELRELSRQVAEDGVSIVATDTSNGKIIAVAFNKIQTKPISNEEPFFLKFRNNMKSPNAKCLMDFMITMDSEIDVFQMFNIDCVCEIMFVATLPKFGKKGIGFNLVKFSIELIRNWNNNFDLEYIEKSLRDKHPKAVTALFTSSFSQKIGKSLNFDILNSVPHSRFSFNGKTFDQRIGDLHKHSEQVVLYL